MEKKVLQKVSCLVTTSDKPLMWQVDKAKKIVRDIAGGLYVERQKYSIKKIQSMFLNSDKGIDVLVVNKTKNVVYSNGDVFFFHPNMAELRVENLYRGQSDNMLEAMKLREGMSILDCTLGLAADAIVASWAVGKNGRVVGLESAQIIAAIVNDGLQNIAGHSVCEKKALKMKMLEAMHRIEIVCEFNEKYLLDLPDKSFDVVYFDPMFRDAVQNSVGIKPLRNFANFDLLKQSTLTEACRVAKKRVVIKEKRGSKEFSRLQCERILAGKYSSVAYGIIDV